VKPIKAQPQNFSEDFVRAYFLRQFFQRLRVSRNIGWLSDRESNEIYVLTNRVHNNLAITPNEVFQYPNNYGYVKQLANDYAEKMIELWRQGWLIMGNNSYNANDGELRAREKLYGTQGSRHHLWDEKTWIPRYTDTGGMLPERLTVSTFLFPKPKDKDIESTPRDSIEKMLNNGGIIWMTPSSQTWGFVLKINDAYSVNFTMGEWKPNYGFRFASFDLVKTKRISMLKTPPDYIYFGEPNFGMGDDDYFNGGVKGKIMDYVPLRVDITTRSLNYARSDFI